MAGKLTARFAEAVKKPGRHGDGNGLYLLVKPSGSKSWILRTVVRGRRCDMGLGGYPLVSVAEARAAAFENRKLARAGGDPLALRRRPDIPTFAEAARTVIEIHKPTWRNSGRSAGQWESSLRQYAFPRLGARGVDTITTADVMAVLLPIWTEKAETARRVRQRISAIMKWAIAQGYRADNPAGDAIAAALPKAGDTPKHFRAVHHTKAGDAIRAVRGSQALLSVKLAFEFLVLTAARSGEVRHALWPEFDMRTATWTIPGERMKTGREHRVPLSNRVLEILDEARALDDRSGLVFPGPAGGKPIAVSTLSKLLHDLDIDAVPHGFRSTFRDWCSESAQAPRDLAEACLDLSEEDALTFMLHKHRRTHRLNDFCRIVMAMALEPYWRDRARERQCKGGKEKLSSNLTEAKPIDVRAEIARVAGVGAGNVTKVKQLLKSVTPKVYQALRRGEVKIHRAWQWRVLQPNRQNAELNKYLNGKNIRQAIDSTIECLVRNHEDRQGSGLPIEQFAARLANAAQDSLANITLIVTDLPWHVIVVARDLYEGQLEEKQP